MKANFPTDIFHNIHTPFYYYNTQLLQQTLDTVRHEADKYANFVVHYAVKANANPHILGIIRNAGLGADCVSGGEIQAALDAGFRAQDMVFAGVGKADWEINLALDAGIFCFNVESIAELEVIDELAGLKGKVADVCFRINPDIDAHTHANITTGLAENKFGIAMEDMLPAIRRAEEMQNVRFIGLHFHIGSQILEMDAFEKLCDRINQLQDTLEANHIRAQVVNVGGGLGVDYTSPRQNETADFSHFFEVYDRHLKLRDGQTLHFELGRAIVAQMGTLIAKTLYIKQGTHKKFAILDAGMTDLIRPALYQAEHYIENIDSDEAQDVYDVVGPICESSDVFAKDYRLNRLHRGDLVAIHTAGAYGEIMASQYNCRKLPRAYTSDELKAYDFQDI